MKWKVVGAFILGIAIGSGVIYVYDKNTGAYKYTCTCTTIGGEGPRWLSYPEGYTCPPPGMSKDVCP
jgi:hypothetical protein